MFNPKPSPLQNHRNANKSLTKLPIEETVGGNCCKIWKVNPEIQQQEKE